MLDILNYVCHGLARSENAIANLTKHTRRQSVMYILLGVTCLGLANAVSTNAREVQALKRKIKLMEESQQEKGA